jgi:hypothetical protein
MHIRTTDGYRVGQRIIVRNGAKGEQVAVIASVPKIDRLRVHKWLARGQRWTDRVSIHPAEVLRSANAEDFRKRRVSLTSLAAI